MSGAGSGERPRRLRRRSTGGTLTVQKSSLLGSGGEGAVYALPNDPGLVAKVYHQPSLERARKLEIMIQHPPDDPMTGGHRSFAWPTELLVDDRAGGAVVGFLMSRVLHMRPAFDFYNPASRRDRAPLFNALYLHRAARNMAAAVGALHAREYVMGDVNESNFLLEATALVTLVDTDSFQVRDPVSGACYRCRVGKPEFTPPELQETTFAFVDRRPEHDLFGLAVLLFHMLLEGTHPFAGVFQGDGDPPPIGARISSASFPHRRRHDGSFSVPPLAPPFEILHPELRRLFVECFDEGHRDPARRPRAATWQAALKEAEADLVVCRGNDQHHYGRHLDACPWCERARRLGQDPFPSRAAVARNTHRGPRAPKRAPTVVPPRGPRPGFGPGLFPPITRMPNVSTLPPAAAAAWAQALKQAPSPWDNPFVRKMTLGCGGLIGAFASLPLVALLSSTLLQRGWPSLGGVIYLATLVALACAFIGAWLANRNPRAFWRSLLRLW
jgi:DNA-binding helix-hairpin-helix protein with protein kinase domain